MEAICNCPHRCSEIDYEHSLSTSKYPSVGYLKEIIANKNQSVFDSIERDFSENNLAISIYFEEVNRMNITDVPNLSILGLLSNIGGNMIFFYF